jgi:hypothetical protein
MYHEIIELANSTPSDKSYITDCVYDIQMLSEKINTHRLSNHILFIHKFIHDNKFNNVDLCEIRDLAAFRCLRIILLYYPDIASIYSKIH